MDDDDDDEQELTFDEHGRTATDGTCDYRTRVWDAAVPEASVPSLVADCKAAYLKVTTQTGVSGLTYSTNATYWMGAEASPRTALERLALSIFRHHSRRARFDPARSGAEWWTQVVSAQEEETGTIGFHWDRDYDLQYDQGLCVHPHVATVTYLCGGGAPTVVLPLASPVDAAAVADACCGPLRGAHACWPRPGRHLAFDGRMLHGAPQGLAATGGGGGGGGNAPRVTLLVNVWLNHVPWAADPLHDEARRQMRAPPPPPIDLSRPCGPSRRSHGGGPGEPAAPHRWEVTHVGGDPMALVLPAAAEWAAEADAGGFVAAAFRADGAAALERAPPRPPPPADRKRKR